MLCSHYAGRVRFSELTLDAFRMMRACEWDESVIGMGRMARMGSPGGGDVGGLGRRFGFEAAQAKLQKKRGERG